MLVTSVISTLQLWGSWMNMWPPTNQLGLTVTSVSIKVLTRTSWESTSGDILRLAPKVVVRSMLGASIKLLGLSVTSVSIKVLTRTSWESTRRRLMKLRYILVTSVISTLQLWGIWMNMWPSSIKSLGLTVLPVCLSMYWRGHAGGPQEEDSWFRFDCDQCVYQGTDKNKLGVHKKKTHEAKVYACDQCHFNSSTLGSWMNMWPQSIKSLGLTGDQCVYLGTDEDNLGVHFGRHTWARAEGRHTKHASSDKAPSVKYHVKYCNMIVTHSGNAPWDKPCTEALILLTMWQEVHC